MHGRNLLSLFLWQKAGPGFLVSFTTLKTTASSMCVIWLEANISSGTIDVFEETDANGTESCCNVGWCGCFIPRFDESIAKAVLGESVICAATIKQQTFFIPVTHTWSKDRLVHKVYFMGSLTWKVEKCYIMAVCSFHYGMKLVWCHPDQHQ